MYVLLRHWVNNKYLEKNRVQYFLAFKLSKGKNLKASSLFTLLKFESIYYLSIIRQFKFIYLSTSILQVIPFYVINDIP